MTIRKIYILFSFVLFGVASSFAQNVADAVRWSQHNPGGTARTFGVGSAFGAMGGDFAVLNINPAGLGEYARGEFMITPSLNFNTTTSYLKGDGTNRLDEGKSTFKIDNIGFVINRNPGTEWTHSNWAIGYNKIKDLNRSFFYSGKTAGSITEEFAEYANGNNVDNLDDFRGYPAYRVGAIYDLDNDNFYETDFQEDPSLPIQKNQFVDQEGYINELSIAWGGKYNNKLNIGAQIGIPFVSFEETKVYEESDPDGEVPAFDELKFTEYLNTSGAGVNFKAGFIYEITKMVRLGGAIHSPTWYTLNDDFYTNLEYTFTVTNQENFEERSPDGSFRYGVNTPWKVIGSLGSIYKIAPGVVGFINADVEWLDYTESSVDFTKSSSDPAEAQNSIAINQEIQKELGSSLNIRVGSELGVKKLRLRAGFELGQSPFSADTDRNSALSFGIGFRENNFFLDAGIRFRSYTEGYLPYTVIDKDRDPLVLVETKSSRFLLTAGFKF